MYAISNRQYDEIIEMLTAFAGRDDMGCSLREQNRYRRARLLIRDLKKRKQMTITLSTKNK